MKSRVFRVPAGMGASEYNIRKNDKVAVVQHTIGDYAHSSLEDAPTNRIPKVESVDSGNDVATRSPGRAYQESIQRSDGVVLPVRQESEIDGSKENERSNELLDLSGTSDIRCDGRRVFEEKDSIEASEGAERTCRSSNITERGEDSRDGSNPKSNEQTKKCFLDSTRICEVTCAAFVIDKQEPCSILDLISILKINYKPVRPSVPSPYPQQKLRK